LQNQAATKRPSISSKVVDACIDYIQERIPHTCTVPWIFPQNQQKPKASSIFTSSLSNGLTSTFAWMPFVHYHAAQIPYKFNNTVPTMLMQPAFLNMQYELSLLIIVS